MDLYVVASFEFASAKLSFCYKTRQGYGSRDENILLLFIVAGNNAIVTIDCSISIFTLAML